MTEHKVSDPDILGVEPAMLRAAKQARIIAAVTDVPLVLWEDGRIVRKKISLSEARRLQKELKADWEAFEQQQADHRDSSKNVKV